MRDLEYILHLPKELCLQDQEGRQLEESCHHHRVGTRLEIVSKKQRRPFRAFFPHRHGRSLSHRALHLLTTVRVSLKVSYLCLHLNSLPTSTCMSHSQSTAFRNPLSEAPSLSDLEVGTEGVVRGDFVDGEGLRRSLSIRCSYMGEWRRNGRLPGEVEQVGVWKMMEEEESLYWYTDTSARMMHERGPQDAWWHEPIIVSSDEVINEYVLANNNVQMYWRRNGGTGHHFQHHLRERTILSPTDPPPAHLRFLAETYSRGKLFDLCLNLCHLVLVHFILFEQILLNG